MQASLEELQCCANMLSIANIKCTQAGSYWNHTNWYNYALQLILTYFSQTLLAVMVNMRSNEFHKYTFEHTAKHILH